MATMSRKLSSPSASTRRLLVTTAAAASLCAVSVMLVRSGLPQPEEAGPASAEELVQRVLVWAAVVLSAWLGLGAAVAVGATLPGAVGTAFARLSRWLTPRVLRQAVALALGTAVATVALPVSSATGGGLTSAMASVPSSASGDMVNPPSPPAAPGSRVAPDPAMVPTRTPDRPSVDSARGTRPPVHAGQAEPGGMTSTSQRYVRSAMGLAGVTETATAEGEVGKVARPDPDPQWRPSPPSRVVDPARSALLAPMPRARTTADATVTVLRGDTLWHLAARHLDPGASDAEIAHEWPRWYAANRNIIGSDPDRLIPGQQLRIPPAGAR